MTVIKITRRQALELAIQALQDKRRQFAVDASYHDVWKSDNPSAVNASKRKTQITEAIEELRKAQEETVK
jgi:hypothetical protein